MPVTHVAEQAGSAGNRALEPCKAHGASRSESEPGSASKRKLRAANLSEMVKPVLAGKSQACAPVELSGVVGDSAYRERSRGTWEIRRAGVLTKRRSWECI